MKRTIIGRLDLILQYEAVPSGRKSRGMTPFYIETAVAFNEEFEWYPGPVYYSYAGSLSGILNFYPDLKILSGPSIFREEIPIFFLWNNIQVHQSGPAGIVTFLGAS